MLVQLCHIQNQAYFEPKGSSKACQHKDDHAYLQYSQKSLFKNFQGYLGIFRHTEAYSATLTGVQLGGRVDALPFLKIEKRPIVSIRGLNFLFKILVLRVGEKAPKCFLARPLFLLFFKFKGEHLWNRKKKIFHFKSSSRSCDKAIVTWFFV